MQDSSQGLAGVVLAGVHRWGESAFERLLPRPLVPVADSPLICYVLRWLRDAGSRSITVCANSDSRALRRCLGDGTGLGLDLRYYEDLAPRGPAGCVRDAAVHWPAQDLLVIEGSVIPPGRPAGLLAAHRRSGAAMTVAVAARAGADAATGSPVRPLGIYAFARPAVEAVPVTGYQDIKEVLIPRLHARGERVLTYELETACPRVTGIDTYLAANQWVLEWLGSEPMGLAGYRRAGQALVHHSARLADGVRLVGPLLIGPDSRLAAGTTLVGPVTIGQGCVVEEQAVVCRSVIWDRCHVGRGALVDRSVLAFDAAVAAGARLHNVLHAHRRDRPAPFAPQAGRRSGSAGVPAAPRRPAASRGPDRRPGRPASLEGLNVVRPAAQE